MHASTPSIAMNYTKICPLLAYRYMPSNDPTVIRTVIDQKERQIDKLRDEVERLRKILLERDTGIPTDPDTVLPKNQNR